MFFVVVIRSIMLADTAKPLVSDTSFYSFAMGAFFRSSPSREKLRSTVLEGVYKVVEGDINLIPSNCSLTAEARYRGRHLTSISTLPTRAFLLLPLRFQPFTDHLPKALPRYVRSSFKFNVSPFSNAVENSGVTTSSISGASSLALWQQNNDIESAESGVVDRLMAMTSPQDIFAICLNDYDAGNRLC